MIGLAEADRLAPPATEQCDQSVGEIERAARIADLIVDDGKFIALARKPHDGLDEIVTERAVEPGGADDQMIGRGGANLLLADQLAPPVGAGRSGRVVLAIGALADAIEDIIGRDVDDRNTALAGDAGQGAGGIAVEPHREVGLVLGLVDVGKSGRIDDHSGRDPVDRAGKRLGAPEIEFGSSGEDRFEPVDRRRLPGERKRQLTVTSGDEQFHAAVPSRSPR